SRNLLRQHELATGVIFFRLAQEQDQLHWKENLAVQILVQRVMSALTVFENERCGLRLTLGMAESLEFGERGRKPLSHSEPLHPLIGDMCEFRINPFANGLKDFGQRVSEIFVFSQSKPVSFHDNGFPVKVGLVIGGDEPVAISASEQLGDMSITLAVQLFR